MTTNPVEPAVGVEDLSIRYDSGLALDGVSITIHSGERVALLGPSGAGKSSLLSAIAGLARPSRGRVRTLGVVTSELMRRRNRPTRAQIATIAQDFALLPDARVLTNLNAGSLGRESTVRSVLALMRPKLSSEAAEALRRVQLVGREWEVTSDLSGGQQQRLAIARALLQRPSLVLADEPVSALDPGLTTTVLKELLVEPKITVIASMHNPETALQHFDRIVGIRAGRLLFDERAANLDQRRLQDLYLTDHPTRPEANEPNIGSEREP